MARKRKLNGYYDLKDFVDYSKKKGSCWRTEKSAGLQANSLRQTEYGTLKCRVFPKIRIKQFGTEWCIKAKESKGYKRWLRTGRGCR